MYNCLNKINPTTAEFRQWAYDEDLIFTEQDEDLILHDIRYVSLLIAFASDPACPKNHYCLTILADYSQSLLANRIITDIEEVEKYINHFKGVKSEPVLEWVQNFQRIRNLILHPRIIGEWEAESIAFDLIVGSHRQMDFAKTGVVNAGYHEYQASVNGVYSEYLYINLQTSDWKFSKYLRLQSVEDNCS